MTAAQLAVVRACMLLAAAITLPAATGLVVSAPFGRFTAVGGFIICCGLGCLRSWWQLRPRSVHRTAVRWITAGAVLTLAATALLEGAAVLALARYPDDPIGAYAPALTLASAGVLCLLARIAVGVHARTLATRGAAARQTR